MLVPLFSILLSIPITIHNASAYPKTVFSYIFALIQSFNYSTCYFNLFSAYISSKSSMIEQLFGSSMYRYNYDLQSGTSHYRRKNGTLESWKSPQRRGNEIFVTKLNFLWRENMFIEALLQTFNWIISWIAFSLATLLNFEIKFS